jgi:HEAT repeat protein
MKRRHVLAGWAVLGLALLAAPGAARAQSAQYLGKRADAWARDLTSKDPVARRGAAFALGKIGSPAVGWLRELLRALREDPSPSVRETAAFAVGAICKGSIRASENPELLRALTERLRDDKDALVRRSAAVALGELGSDAESAAADLVKACKDSSPQVRQNAAWALGQVGAGGVTALARALMDRDALVIRDAANSLGRLGEKARPALPELLGATQNADTEVKKAALLALVGLVTPEDKEAYAPLRAALIDRDIDVRRNAALALGNIGGEEASAAVPVLVDALRQRDNPELRRQAAAVLKNIGPYAQSAINPLRGALTDPDAGLRRNAAVALGGLAKEATSAVPDLVRVLANPKEDADVRVEAAVALSRIGPAPAARDAIPTLVKVLQDAGNPAKVRERTLWALRAHAQELPNHPEVFDTLNRIVREPGTHLNRMLRYDSAFILGHFQKDAVSKEVLDVLSEFLKDTSIKIFKGNEVSTGAATTGERSGREARVVERGIKDGRVMAVQALTKIGRTRVRARQDIMGQLRRLRDDPKTFPELRDQIREALTEFGQ